MKGISAIIAVVLILLITVALAAAAYLFFSTTFSSITQTAGSTISGATEQFRILYSIESAKNTSLTGFTFSVRNVGQVPITIDNIGVYVDDIPATNINPSTGTISPNSLQTFTATSVANINCGKSILKVTFQNAASSQTAIIAC
ncbi:MAG: archaellin/type IV pilin N-terminal domain-containing protein [Candidatus Aenigmatarchaeota archaeon]